MSMPIQFYVRHFFIDQLERYGLGVNLIIILAMCCVIHPGNIIVNPGPQLIIPPSLTSSFCDSAVRIGLS